MPDLDSRVVTRCSEPNAMRNLYWTEFLHFIRNNLQLESFELRNPRFLVRRISLQCLSHQSRDYDYRELFEPFQRNWVVSGSRKCVCSYDWRYIELPVVKYIHCDTDGFRRSHLGSSHGQLQSYSLKTRSLEARGIDAVAYAIDELILHSEVLSPSLVRPRRILADRDSTVISSEKCA